MNTWTSFENNYDVRHLVFRDDVSTTYTARRKSDGKTVAARKFLLFLLGPTERLAVDNEISILQKISHPNVPAYKEIRFSNDSKIMYVITAYVQSETLACLISNARERGTHIEERTIWGFIADLLDLLQFILLPHKQYFADDEHIDFISLDPREIMVDKSKKLYVRSFTYAHQSDGPEQLVEKTSLYNCYVPGASFSTTEQRNLYILGLLIYELCLLTPYNYYSPIGPWPSCPAEQIFFPLHSRELCMLCKALLDTTKKPRLGLSDLIGMPQIRDVHPTFAVEVAESLNQQTELISSRYNTDCESFLTRGPSYLSALKHNASDCSLAAEDTTPQGVDRGSVDLHNIFTAPIESLSVNRSAKSTPEPVSVLAQTSARPSSPSRILVDTGQLTPILPRQYLDEPKRSASSPLHIKREHQPFEYLANYPFIKKPSYQIVDTPTTLMKAAIAGDEDLARLSINSEAGCALNTGETALYYALLYKNYQIADLLLSVEGVVVKDDTFSESVVRNQERAFIYGDDRTPLISAALANDLVGVYSLIPFYARFQDAQGKTALMHAIEYGHSEVACLLARSEHGLVDTNGMYATLFSILHNNPVVFKMLYIKESGLLKGDGFTPLMISAALDGKASISSQLQRYKAMRTKRGLTAMMIAVHCSENLDILHELVKHEAGIRDEKGDTALMHAIYANKELAVQLLAKFEGTLTDASGKTALMRAALEGFSQVIPMLQVQARKADSEGKTALMHAIESGNITAAAMLATMEAGARDSAGETALIKALRCELPAIAKLLIPLETKYTDLSGNYASKQAIMQGNRALLELLIPHELELLYNDGFTALMIAVASFNMTTVRNCLRDVGKQTKSGLTALMIAVLVGNKQAIPFLLEENHLVDKANQKAVDYARKLNEAETIKLLDEKAEIDRFTKKLQSPNKTHAVDTDQIHRSSVLTMGCHSSTEDRFPIDVVKEEDQQHTLSPRTENLSHVATATPQALVSMERNVTRADTARSFSSSTELLKPVRSPLATRSANTSVFSNGSVGNKSFNSLRRTIEMDRRYDGYEPEARRSSAKLPKRPISAVPTKPAPTATPWGATIIDFTTLSLEMDSVSNDFPDTTRAQSPGMDMADLSCEEFAIQKTSDVQKTNTIPVDKPGRNPLLSAVLTNDVSASARNLNYSGAHFGKSKKTALIVAADRGNTEIVRLLEPHEAGQATTSGWTALMRAAVHNHVDCVSILMEREAGLVNHRSMSALMIATELGHIEVVSRLAHLEAGLRNTSYYTALMLAAKRGYAEIVEILAPHEANYTRSNGATALMYAIQNRHTGCVRILANYEAGRRLDNGWTALMMAAQNGFLDAVELLKSYEGKMQNINGSTALMLAAQNKRLAAVKLLLNTEAAMTNSQGATALMMASENGSIAICQMLEPRERGIMTNNGSTALMFASRVGNTEIVSLLLNSEAGKQSGMGHSALMLASQAGAIEVCSLLLKKEQCLRTQDGTTALMMAARAGHHMIVELLAPYEAGVRRNDGVTARIIALSKGHTACAQLLERFEP